MEPIVLWQRANSDPHLVSDDRAINIKCRYSNIDYESNHSSTSLESALLNSTVVHQGGNNEATD